MTNSRPAFRKDDTGIHAACCNQNTWKAVQGSATVFINNKEAVRLGDQTKHCGGSGNMIEGSDNVMIGGASAGGGGGGSGGGSSSAQAGAGTESSAGSQSGTNSNQTGQGAGGGSSSVVPTNENQQDESESDEPQPLLVSAKWSQDRVPASTEVNLSAICAEMSGKSATFTIKDADDDTKTIATVNGACGESNVEAKWTTPKDGPPGRFVFKVEADGKEADSGVLTMINEVEVRLLLDEEPAKGVKVTLRADPSGETISAEADDKGVVKFEQAPFGDYMLILDDGENS